MFMKKELLNPNIVAIDDIFDMTQAIQRDTEDFIIPSMTDLYMDRDSRLEWNDMFGIHSYDVSDWALRQLSDKIIKSSRDEKVSSFGNYLISCRNNGMPELVAENVNKWIQHREINKSAFVRTYQDEIRGILSPRYTPCDAPQIVETIADVLPEKEWNIKGSYLDESRMHLRFVGDRNIRVNNDLLFPAIFVDSSDVGRCALHVQFGIYRLACTNGLVIAAAHMMYHQRHVGIDRYEFVAELQNSLRHIPDMITNAEEVITIAKANRLNLLTEDDIEAVMKELRAKTKLSKKEAERVLDIQRASYDDSRWGLVNAITEFAHDATLEKRLELEKSAGLLLAA